MRWMQARRHLTDIVEVSWRKGLARQAQVQDSLVASGADTEKKKGPRKGADEAAEAEGAAEEEGRAGAEGQEEEAHKGMEQDGDMLTSSPEYLLVYLLYALAHSNGWPDSPTTASKKDLEPFVRSEAPNPQPRTSRNESVEGSTLNCKRGFVLAYCSCKLQATYKAESVCGFCFVCFPPFCTACKVALSSDALQNSLRWNSLRCASDSFP